MHAWPCNPNYQERVRLATAPWTELTRCPGCGSLWEAMDRGWKRVTVARAREVFGVEIPPLERPELGGPSDILGLRLVLNRGALFRIVVVTEAGHWQVGERGALMWIFVRDIDALEPATAHRAIDIARSTWGEEAGAVLRLALDNGFDPRELGALDLAHGFRRETWERPWQPSAVALVEAMFAAGRSTTSRIAAVLGRARRDGMLADEDIVAAGFTLPPSPAVTGRSPACARARDGSRDR